MLNLQRFALPVKRMTATGLLVLAGETIRELRAVVGQQFGDLNAAASCTRRKKSTALPCV